MTGYRWPWRPWFVIAPVAVSAVVVVLAGRAAEPVQTPESLQVGQGVTHLTAAATSAPSVPRPLTGSPGSLDRSTQSKAADSSRRTTANSSQAADPSSVTIVTAPRQVVVTDDGSESGDHPSGSPSWTRPPGPSAEPSASGSPSQSPDE